MWSQIMLIIQEKVVSSVDDIIRQTHRLPVCRQPITEHHSLFFLSYKHTHTVTNESPPNCASLKSIFLLTDTLITVLPLEPGINLINSVKTHHFPLVLFKLFLSETTKTECRNEGTRTRTSLCSDLCRRLDGFLTTAADVFENLLCFCRVLVFTPGYCPACRDFPQVLASQRSSGTQRQCQWQWQWQW